MVPSESNTYSLQTSSTQSKIEPTGGSIVFDTRPMSRSKQKHQRWLFLLRKCFARIFGTLLALYMLGILLVLTPWVQTHVVYAHRIKYFGFNSFEYPEDYGIAPGKAFNLRLHAADNTSLGAWFILSDPFYHSLPFPQQLPQESDHDTLIRDALQHSPTILFLHGNTGTRALDLRMPIYTAFTGRLRANVLVIDYRGFADSEGEPTVSGVGMDAMAAWDWIAERKGGVNPGKDIVVVGHSLGTAVAGMLSAELGRKGVDVRGVALLSPFSSTRLLMDQYALFGVLPLLKPLARMPIIPRVLTWSLAHNFDTLSQVPDIKASVLVAHAEDDWDISHRHASVIFNALVEPYLPPTSDNPLEHPATILPPNNSSAQMQNLVPWDWQGLTKRQALRAAQQARVVKVTEVKGFGTFEEFVAGGAENKRARKIMLLKTRSGGHDIARMEGVQDAIGRMFALI